MALTAKAEPRLRYRYVDRTHYVPAWRTDHEELFEARKDFPKDMSPSTHAIVVHDSRGMVAFFRFWSARGRLYAGGTYVAPNARGKGLATEMWRRVLEHHDCSRIFVRTISTAGRSLVASLVRDHPGLSWEVNT